MLISIPPRYAVSRVVGFIKGKNAMHLAPVYGERKRNFPRAHADPIPLAPTHSDRDDPLQPVRTAAVQDKIAEVFVGSDAIKGMLAEPLCDGRKLFYTVRVDRELAEQLKAHGVKVTGIPSSNFLSNILSWVLPIFVFYLIWMYAIRHLAERQGIGGLMTVGKSRAKVYVETDTKVTFRDVAGIDEAKYEL
jgi:cell division protease FtsH